MRGFRALRVMDDTIYLYNIMMLYIQESPENVSGKSTIDQFEIFKEIRMPSVKCRKILEL